jgi:DNA invertase Pin-like site-specific DNA recombinase
MAVFGYGRVSTAGQTVENQRLELERAGVGMDFWLADEGVSGAVPAMQRPQFKVLLDRIRPGEALIVGKLDRLGRDAIDVLQTVRTLADRAISVKVLNLGGVDLTSPAGKMLLHMLAAVAEMERDLLVERTQAGLQRARAEGKKLGRRPATTATQRATIRQRLAAGESVAAVAREHGLSRATVATIRDQQEGGEQ